MNVNCLLMTGRVTKDAEQITTKKGTSMSKFRLAVNDRRSDDTLFMNVVCFGKMAESLNQYLLKGRLVSVQGKLKCDEYEDKEGVNRTSYSVMADEISLGPNSQNSQNANADRELETVQEVGF
jgi:single-strand DNA-binding protein